MNKIKSKDLESICGGTTISGTIITAFTNVIKVLMDAGHSVGSAIRRISSNDLCPLK